MKEGNGGLTGCQVGRRAGLERVQKTEKEIKSTSINEQKKGKAPINESQPSYFANIAHGTAKATHVPYTAIRTLVALGINEVSPFKRAQIVDQIGSRQLTRSSRFIEIAIGQTGAFQWKIKSGFPAQRPHPYEADWHIP
jgi:hypothetical protein